MRNSYLKYYTKHTYLAPFCFLVDFFTEIEPRKRLSIWNRLSDYISILLNRDKNLLLFHKQINQSLLSQSSEYSHYDYGEGYFYQSLALANVSGFRNAVSIIGPRSKYRQCVYSLLSISLKSKV